MNSLLSERDPSTVWTSQPTLMEEEIHQWTRRRLGVHSKCKCCHIHMTFPKRISIVINKPLIAFFFVKYIPFLKKEKWLWLPSGGQIQDCSSKKLRPGCSAKRKERRWDLGLVSQPEIFLEFWTYCEQSLCIHRFLKCLNLRLDAQPCSKLKRKLHLWVCECSRTPRSLGRRGRILSLSSSSPTGACEWVLPWVLPPVWTFLFLFSHVLIHVFLYPELHN